MTFASHLIAMAVDLQIIKSKNDFGIWKHLATLRSTLVELGELIDGRLWSSIDHDLVQEGTKL